MKGSAKEAQEGDLYTLDELGQTKEMGLTLALSLNRVLLTRRI